MEETNQTSVSVHQGANPICRLVDEANRNLDFNGHQGSTRASTLDAPTNRLSEPLKQASQVTLTEDPGISTGPGSSVVVGDTCKCHDQPISGTKQSRHDNVHRCFQGGLGCPLGIADSLRYVASSLEVKCHQLAGTGGYQASLGRF